jgi:allantoicase
MIARAHLQRRTDNFEPSRGHHVKESNAAASFTGLVDLAAASLGGRALGASDDFFAGADNLLQPGRGVFIEDRFTDRGKWMDGWESRRKREVGHDWCVIALGASGQVVGLDIDTNHFSGNHAPFASVDALAAPRDTPLAALVAMTWGELLPQVALRPSSQNLFAVASATGAAAQPVTHLRLNIFPDGGVARFRAFGRVIPTRSEAGHGPDVEMDDATRAQVPASRVGLVDLAAVKQGGLALCCSDAFFGPMNNLLLPGRAENMGGGWETRRNRGPGHDWIIIQLGGRGTAQLIEVDTNHFKGNYPDRCSIEGIDAVGARMTDLIGTTAWSPVLGEVELSAHTRHFFREELRPHAAISHLRVNIFPDGGLSRVRFWSRRDG